MAPPEEGSDFAAGTLTEAEIRQLVRTVPHTKLIIVTDQPNERITALRREPLRAGQGQRACA